ncbi:MAG TPA: hypothetical protein VIP77_06550 [Jiangellaceae bacterium]
MRVHTPAERRRRVRLLRVRRWLKAQHADTETIIAELRQRFGTDKEEGRG